MTLVKAQKKLHSIGLDIVKGYSSSGGTSYELTDGNIYSVKQLKALLATIKE